MEQQLTNYVRPTKRDIESLQSLDATLIAAGYSYSFPNLTNRSTDSLFLEDASPMTGVQPWVPGKFSGYFWRDGKDGEKVPAHKNFVGTSHLLGPVAITVATLDDGACISIVRTAIVFCVVTIVK